MASDHRHHRNMGRLYWISTTPRLSWVRKGFLQIKYKRWNLRPKITLSKHVNNIAFLSVSSHPTFVLFDICAFPFNSVRCHEWCCKYNQGLLLHSKLHFTFYITFHICRPHWPWQRWHGHNLEPSRVDIRGRNEPSRRLKFQNHGEGHLPWVNARLE